MSVAVRPEEGYNRKGCKLNYDELEDRMKTFKLPPQWEGPLDYQSMAEAGFVYTGQEDLVFCFHCNIKLDRWSKDMEPLLRHKEESPTCSFMRQRLQAVKGERRKTKSVVAPSKPLNSRLTSSIGQLQSSSLVASKSIHTVVTGLNEPRLSYSSFDETGKSKSLVAPSKPTRLNELPLSCEGIVDGGSVAELVVGNGHRQKDPVFSKMTAINNLPVQAEQDVFSTGPTSPPSQPLTEVMVVPLPYFMHVTQAGGILSFPVDWPTADHSDQYISSELISQDRGAIYPPNFDASESLFQSPSSDTVPVQSSEANEHSAVIISAPVPMKTTIADSYPLADLYKSPKTIDFLFGLFKKQGNQLIEKCEGINLHKLICQICRSRKVTYVILPCGHARTCRSCTERSKPRCPFCRHAVSYTNRIYF